MYPHQHFENHAGGWFVDPTGRRFKFVATPDGSDKRRAKREMDAANEGYRRLSFAEREAIRQAETNAREEVRLIEERAKREAAKNAPPTNPYRARANELAQSRDSDERRRAAILAQSADQWDAERAAEHQEAERRVVIESDPFVRTAREFVSNWDRFAPPEFVVEVAACKAYANATDDGSAAWERIDALRAKIVASEDAAIARKMSNANASQAEFREAASRAEAERDRVEASRPKQEPGRDDAGRFAKEAAR